MTNISSLDELREQLLDLERPDKLETGVVIEARLNDLLTLIQSYSDQQGEERERLGRIDGINEAHDQILSQAYAYTGGEGLEDFCGLDDLSRVAMSWKVDRIKQLQSTNPAKEDE